MTEDTLLDSTEANQLRLFVDEIRAQSPGRILPLQILAQDSPYNQLEPFIAKLIQEKTESPGLNISYYEFYNSHLKGISSHF